MMLIASSKRVLKLALALILSACCLSACTTGTQDDKAAKIDRVMAQAAENARTKGHTGQSLSMLEQLYKRTPSEDNALKYARVLRDEGYYNRAKLILDPFATAGDVENGETVLEYALILAATGNYARTEDYARKAVLMIPDSGQAYHVLGIALDAQGHHEQARVAFEKGLDHWEGDPSPILNNMGLNLAALGFLDEAIEMLRKALDTAPNRREIERNLRIVSALQYQPPREGMRLVPKPPRKPETGERADAATPPSFETTFEAKKIATAEAGVETEVETVSAVEVDDVEAVPLENRQ